jgi:CubicO group peptidase (beta-lactamase class C family)
VAGWHAAAGQLPAGVSHGIAGIHPKVTVRMLLNHSSGFPGTDFRGLFTFSPVPVYSAQVLETLKG